MEPATAIQPTWLADLPIWLQHRDKVPHYSGLRSPKPRSGDLDTPDERKRLVAFPRLSLADGFEPGYALGPIGDKILCGVDLDKCFKHDGKVLDMFKMFCTVMREAGALIEVSRSGHGLHIVWLAQPDQTPHGFRLHGIECYTGRRFFAWGTRVIEAGAPTPIDAREAIRLLPVHVAGPVVMRSSAGINPAGGRNNYLRERLEEFARAGLEGDQLLQALLDENQKLVEPLDETEIQKTLALGIDKLRIQKRAVPSEVFAPVDVDVPPPWTLVSSQVALEKPPPVRFVIDGWLQEGKVGLIASEGGTGKTTLMLQMGVCIVTGRDWMNQRVKHGAFVLLSRDDDQDDLDATLQEVCLAMQISEDEHALVKRLLCVMSLRSDPKFKLISGDGRAFEASSFVPHLLREVARVKPVAVAIDTARQFTGTDSVNEGAMITFMSACAQIAALGPAVIVAHHVGKQAAREKIMDMYSAVGSSALADNARFMWRLINAIEDDVELPFEMELPQGAQLLQLHAARPSLRVVQPPDIWYTRTGFVLERINGRVNKLSRDESRQRRAVHEREERLNHLIACFTAIGIVGRDRARDYFKQQGWSFDNNQFSALKPDAAAAVEVLK